jgi:DnaJ-class molecular chaperone
MYSVFLENNMKIQKLLEIESRDPSNVSICPDCNGYGTITKEVLDRATTKAYQLEINIPPKVTKCETCNGTGRVISAVATVEIILPFGS